MIDEAMSITPIVFVLIILLFGFDLAGQLKRPRGARQQLTTSVRTENLRRKSEIF
jgi:hypothetical protein